jgi:hypothetical protein
MPKLAAAPKSPSVHNSRTCKLCTSKACLYLHFVPKNNMCIELTYVIEQQYGYVRILLAQTLHSRKNRPDGECWQFLLGVRIPTGHCDRFQNNTIGQCLNIVRQIERQNNLKDMIESSGAPLITAVWHAPHETSTMTSRESASTRFGASLWDVWPCPS